VRAPTWASVLCAFCAACGDPPPSSCDGGCDAGTEQDAGVDASRPPDAFVETDAGVPIECTQRACASDEECGLGVCVREHPIDVAAELGPIEALPGGVVAGPAALAPSGICAHAHPETAPCSVEAARHGEPDGCGPCARCVASVGGLPPICRTRCEYDEEERGCAEGYTCDPLLEVCVEACTSDADCRIAREDRGTIGVYEGPSVDPLVYDALSERSCDLATGRCTLYAGGTIGAPCARDSECSGGTCLSPARGWDDPHAAALCGALECERFTEGFCTSVGCGGSPFGCPVGSACTTLPTTRAPGETALPFCAPSCVVGELDCRDGYACVPRSDGDGTDDGVCLPLGARGLGAAPIGELCGSDADCAAHDRRSVCHPLALWASLPERPGGTCTIPRCDDATCPGGGCQHLPGVAHPLCLRTCSRETPCGPGDGCVDVDLDRGASTPNVCVPACTNGNQCRPGETCVVARGASIGRCEPEAPTCEAGMDLVAHGIRLEDGSAYMEGRGYAQGPIIQCMTTSGERGEQTLSSARWTPSVSGRARAQRAIVLNGEDAVRVSPAASSTCDTTPAPPFACTTNGRANEIELVAGAPQYLSFSSTEALRVFPPVEVVGSGASCDPRQFVRRCEPGLVCATRDARGPTCGPPTSCAAPFVLNDESAFGARTFSVVTHAVPNASVMVPAFRSPCGPFPKPSVVFRWTAPEDGVLHLSAMGPFGSAMPDPYANPTGLAAEVPGVGVSRPFAVRRACEDPSSELTCYDGLPLPPAHAADSGIPGGNVEVRAGETIFVFVAGDGGPVHLSGALLPSCEGGVCTPGAYGWHQNDCGDGRMSFDVCTELCQWRPTTHCMPEPSRCDPLSFAPCELGAECMFAFDVDANLQNPTDARFACVPVPYGFYAPGNACGYLPVRSAGGSTVTTGCGQGSICLFGDTGGVCQRLCGREAGSCTTSDPSTECRMVDSIPTSTDEPWGACEPVAPDCDPLAATGCDTGYCALGYGGAEPARGGCVTRAETTPLGAPCGVIRPACEAGTVCALSLGAPDPICVRVCELAGPPEQCPTGTCTPLGEEPNTSAPWGGCM
jgi:hypothetical protein